MRKLIYYIGILLVVIILLPMFIVKGCKFSNDEPSNNKQQISDKKIIVYNSIDKKAQEMDFEEYVKGVIAAEMPVEFDMEALKAQAVAARTFTYGRMSGVYKSKEGVHDGIAICTDFSHCQAWVSKDAAKKRWGILFGVRNWSRIEKAVNETKGIIITYNGVVANALFHSNSGGKTENSEDVWDGVSVPYLRSVPSSGEDSTKEYKTVTTIKINDFYNTLIKKFPDIKLKKANIPDDIKVIDYTAGGRVKTIKMGNITIKGTEFRTIFSLRSANFKIEKADKDTLKITAIGYGHGVGMSQWGANYLAKRGGTYDEILKYYYTGVDITTIKEFEAIKAK